MHCFKQNCQLTSFVVKLSFKKFIVADFEQFNFPNPNETRRRNEIFFSKMCLYFSSKTWVYHYSLYFTSSFITLKMVFFRILFCTPVVQDFVLVLTKCVRLFICSFFGLLCNFEVVCRFFCKFEIHNLYIIH